MDDLISRQAAIDATWFEPSYTGPLNVLTEVRDRLKSLPSAEPEQKKGGADVYVKWNKNEAFERYHLNWKKERIDKLYNILYLYRKENIIENFYMYENLRMENNE